MTEDYWYYEEKQRDGTWLDAFGGNHLDKQDAVQVMVLRKAQAPRAKLRLVHVVKTRTEYRNRRNA